RGGAGPAGPPDEAGEPALGAGRHSPSRSDDEPEVSGRAGIRDLQLGPSPKRRDATLELLPRAVPDEAAGDHLCVEAGLRIERDPVLPLAVEGGQVVELREVVEPDDPVQLPSRQAVDANGDRVARFPTAAGRAGHREEAPHALHLDPLARPHTRDARVPRPKATWPRDATAPGAFVFLKGGGTVA